jgi:hypothetical protein
MNRIPQAAPRRPDNLQRISMQHAMPAGRHVNCGAMIGAHVLSNISESNL